MDNQIDIENWLINTCKILLEQDDINITSDFFDLGADSLSVIKLISRIEKKFGEIPNLLEQIFEKSQLSQVARLIHQIKGVT